MLMTNFEKYKDELIMIALRSANIALVNGKPTCRNKTICNICAWKDANRCDRARAKWMKQNI